MAFYWREVLQISKRDILKSTQTPSGTIQRLSKRRVASLNVSHKQLPQQSYTFACSLLFHRALLLLGRVGESDAIRLMCFSNE